MRYCRYILTLLVSLITIGAHADLNVELIETEMTLKKNGDADVMTRVWMESPASIPFSIEMGLWDGTAIEDLTMLHRCLCNSRQTKCGTVYFQADRFHGAHFLGNNPWDKARLCVALHPAVACEERFPLQQFRSHSTTSHRAKSPPHQLHYEEREG